MDWNDVTLELTPGIGGEEAKIFGYELVNMYKQYALHQGWTFDYCEKDNTGRLKTNNNTFGYSSSLNCFQQRYLIGLHMYRRLWAELNIRFENW